MGEIAAVAEPYRLKRQRRPVADGIFKGGCVAAGVALLVVLVLILIKLGQVSQPVWRGHAGELISGTTWAPGKARFGAFPMLYGTLVTSAVALLISVPVALGTALFVTEMAPVRIKNVIAGFTDLLAAVPSVVYGLWGIFVLVPAIRPLEQALSRTLGDHVAFFGPPAAGIGYLTAGVLLAIMVLPTVAAVSREVLATIPRSLREAALSLGATPWESIRMAVLPGARPGIIGAVMLGLGRAFGETIAVTMVIGNSPALGRSILAPGYTMASVIANEFSEATGPLHIEALIAVGLLLFAVTLLVNILARTLVRRAAVRSGRR